MNATLIEQEFREKVCASLRLEQEGRDRYRVFTPFTFADGDHIAIVLKRHERGWVISDEGHTLFELTYEMDEKSLQKGKRQEIIDSTIEFHGLQECDGELLIPVESGDYGDALYTFVQAVLRIADVRYLSRERVRSTFLDDFRALIAEHVPEDRLRFDWHDPQRDPKEEYTVDCRLDGGETPVFLFPLANDAQTRDATINLLQFQKWGIGFESVGVFEDQVIINRKVLARFTNEVDRQYANLAPDKIVPFLQRAVA